MLIAVIVLYVLHFSGKTKNVEEQTGLSAVVPNAKIVYINMDSLLSNYEQSRELNEAFLKKVENNRTELNMKAKMFEQEVVAFQQKLDNNGFVTRERAEQAQADLMVKRQNLQKLDQELMETTQREQIELNQKLFTEITNFLKEYNKTKKFDIIISKAGDNLLYANPKYDITNDVVKGLNKRYKTSPELEKKLRDEAFEKSKNEKGEYQCACCGRTGTSRVAFQVDHIVPMNAGGKTVPENLQILCRQCNGAKSDRI